LQFDKLTLRTSGLLNDSFARASGWKLTEVQGQKSSWVKI